MKIKVSELIVNYMERLGIEYIFGMPGAHILPVYDSLYDAQIRTVLVKHEQGAAFMASGYARASGRISACITTAGPGATNLVTGIANAYADRQPLLIITGETSTHIFGKGGLQESSGEGGSIDQAALFKSITGYNKIVERTDYLGQVLRQATAVLHAASPAPVLLSFPFNVQSELVDDAILQEIRSKPRRPRVHQGAPQIEAVCRAIAAARRPVIIAGHGCLRAGAEELVERLSSSLGIPVATSLKAKGVIGERSPLSLGSLGVTSNGYAYRYIVEQADLLLFFGAGFNERTSYLWDRQLLQHKQIVQIDNDHGQLEKVFAADIAIHSDIREALRAMLDAIDAAGLQCARSVEINGRDALSEGAAVDDSSVSSSKFALLESFFTRLEQRFPADLQVFDDNIIFAQNFFHVSSRNRYYPNSGISSLGQAIPAAIGARFAAPLPTFAILGDGGFQMCCMEIMTAVNYRLPLNVVVLNNATMGLIRKNQRQQYHGRYIDCDFVNPDYAALARSFAIGYQKISSEEDLDALFRDFDLVDAINLIEIVIDKNALPNYRSGR
jgi:acetolactate synthase I/II/III large subunit